MGSRTYPFDAELVLKDAGLIAASAAATVGGDAMIFDAGDARLDAMLVINMTAIEIASNTEVYRIILQGSNSPTFASGIQNLAGMEFGATEVRAGGAGDSEVGQYEMPFCNEQDDTRYRYLRLYTQVGGDVATGINYAAHIVELPSNT